MSRLVVDASITLSWLLPDEGSALSLAVRNELLKAESVWCRPTGDLRFAIRSGWRNGENASIPQASRKPLRRGASLASLDGPLRLVAHKLAVPLLPKKL